MGANDLLWMGFGLVAIGAGLWRLVKLGERMINATFDDVLIYRSDRSAGTADGGAAATSASI